MNRLVAIGTVFTTFAVSAGLPTAAVDFLRDVQPVLAAHCSKCHGESKQKGGLRLDQKSAALRGGESGPGFVVGRPEKSELLRRVISDDPDTRMPPEGPRLTEAEAKILRDWIAAGATWPDDPIAEAAQRHWAFRRPVRPLGSSPSQKNWATTNSIDVLLAVKHAELGLQPLPEADRLTLIRRVTLDLTGLPPTPEEVAAFETDRSPTSYEQLVERLLASPRHGERWGRFWLDLARWAESDGFEANEPRSSAWRYRDYVVGAFNSDKPYDRFLREQIAGDELEPYADEHLIATGFLAAGRSNNNEEDKSVQLNGPRVDMANTVASVTLGLTLQCAQCHDHKFEPLTTRDYYSLHGFFVGGQINNLVLRDPGLLEEWEKSRPPELATAHTLLAQLQDTARKKIKQRPATTDAKETSTGEPTDDQLQAAWGEDDRKLVESLRKKITAQEKALLERKPHSWGYYAPATSGHLIENLPPRGQYPFSYQPDVLKTNLALVLRRGDPHTPAERVTPGLPSVLDRRATHLTSRSQLVDWLVSDANPLTARVWVNFVWQQHFGRGLVETSGDFGLRGAPPSNQPLLDWLACEFRQPSVTTGEVGGPTPPHAWSTKHLHRLIVTSAAYKRAALHETSNVRIDPDNRHLWRWEPRRLESEALRDAMLSVAGLLEEKMGGPSRLVTNIFANGRSLYLIQQRNILPAMQRLFDAPTATESCPRRHASTGALQPLHLLNNPGLVRIAEAFAGRVEREAGTHSARQIERACRLALNRTPDEQEREWAMKFLATSGPSDPAPARPSLALLHFCQALLNLNEFAYLE